MTRRPNFQKSIHADMLVEASDKGQAAFIGRVTGLETPQLDIARG